MTSTQHTRITRAHETDIPSLLSLNNRYSAAGLTLARTPEFAANHLGDYRVLRDASGGILGCVALDDADIDALRALLPKGMRTDVLILP